MRFQRPMAQYAVIGLILGLFFLTVVSFLSPVLLGLFAALMAYPLHNYLRQKTGLPNSLSGLAVTLFVTVVFVLPLVFAGITVVNEALVLVPKFDASALLSGYEQALKYIPLPRTVIEENARALTATLGGLLTRMVTSFLASLPNFLLETLLFIVTLYYGLVDGPRLANYIWDCLPFQSREVATLSHTAERISRAVVAGSLISALVQGCIMGVSYALVGIPGALLFGTLTALLSFVPALGCGPTGLGGALYLWSRGETRGAIFILSAFVVAVASDNIVKPWILRGQSSLHPLLGLISALGGLAMFGFAGLFLGPLFAALTIVVLDVVKDQR